MVPRILIVDDSLLARRIMRLHLEDIGYAVEEATNGEQAIERVFVNPPSLVILDLVMAGMYGGDVLNTLQKLNSGVPVMIATADVQISTADEVRTAGAFGILNKPISRQSLNIAVETVLGGKQLWS